VIALIDVSMRVTSRSPSAGLSQIVRLRGFRRYGELPGKPEQPFDSLRLLRAFDSLCAHIWLAMSEPGA